MEKNLCTNTVDSRNYSHEFRLLFLSSIFAVIYNFHKCYEVEFCAKYLHTITITPLFLPLSQCLPTPNFCTFEVHPIT